MPRRWLPLEVLDSAQVLNVAMLTLADVARELGVSRRLVTSWVDSGELRAVERIGRGRGIRIDRAWLDAFLRARERRPPAASARAPTSSSDRPYRTVAEARADLLGKR